MIRGQQARLLAECYCTKEPTPIRNTPILAANTRPRTSIPIIRSQTRTASRSGNAVTIPKRLATKWSRATNRRISPQIPTSRISCVRGATRSGISAAMLMANSNDVVLSLCLNLSRDIRLRYWQASQLLFQRDLRCLIPCPPELLESLASVFDASTTSCSPLGGSEPYYLTSQLVAKDISAQRARTELTLLNAQGFMFDGAV